MTTLEDIENNNLLEDSEYYAEKGYCITPEEHIKEANNAIIQLTKKNKELSKKFKELKSFILRSKKFKVREDFHLFVLLEEISKKIDEVNNAKH